MKGDPHPGSTQLRTSCGSTPTGCFSRLADFDKRFKEISGEWPSDYEDIHGKKAFWKVVNSVDEFFYSLDLMEDARELYDAVVHLKPKILTGGHDDKNFHHTEDQKRRWFAVHFPGQEVHVCKSVEKSTFMKPGDVIVDDMKKYMHLWEEKGGHWVLHTSAKDSIEQLKELGVL